MDAAEFAEWIAYDQVEPFGEDREDMRAALVPYILSLAFAKRGKKPKFEDFLISRMFEAEDIGKPVMTQGQMMSVLKGIALDAQKAKDQRGNNH